MASKRSYSHGLIQDNLDEKDHLLFMKKIEEYGGRLKAECLYICNTNPEVFGHRGTQKRRAFTRLMENWKRLKIYNYWKLLLESNVEPHENTKAEYEEHVLQRTNDEQGEGAVGVGGVEDDENVNKKTMTSSSSNTTDASGHLLPNKMLAHKKKLTEKASIANSTMSTTSNYDDDGSYDRNEEDSNYSDDEKKEEELEDSNEDDEEPEATLSTPTARPKPRLLKTARFTPPTKASPRKKVFSSPGHPSSKLKLSQGASVSTPNSSSAAAKAKAAVSSISLGMAGMSINSIPPIVGNPFGGGSSKQDRIVVLVNLSKPHANHIFRIQHFPSQRVTHRTRRDVIEVLAACPVPDLDGTVATIPDESEIPAEYVGRLVDIEMPRLSFWLRQGQLYTNKSGLACENTADGRKEADTAMELAGAKKYYRLVFPVPVDCTFFRTVNDNDNEVHRSDTPMEMGASDPEGFGVPVTGYVVSWRFVVNSGKPAVPMSTHTKKTDHKANFSSTVTGP